MDDGPLGADGDDDQVAVPGGELLERGEQLVALGTACCTADALLDLARGQVEQLELLLGGGLRVGGAFARAVEEPLSRVTRLELRVGVDGAGNLEQRLTPLGRLRIEQARRTVEPAARRGREPARARRSPRAPRARRGA